MVSASEVQDSRIGGRLAEEPLILAGKQVGRAQGNQEGFLKAGAVQLDVSHVVQDRALHPTVATAGFHDHATIGTAHHSDPVQVQPAREQRIARIQAGQFVEQERHVFQPMGNVAGPATEIPAIWELRGLAVGVVRCDDNVAVAG